MATATKKAPSTPLEGAFEDPIAPRRGRDFYADMLPAMESPGQWYRMPGNGYATGTKVDGIIEKIKAGEIGVPNELDDWEFTVGVLKGTKPAKKQLYVRYNGEPAESE